MRDCDNAWSSEGVSSVIVRGRGSKTFSGNDKMGSGSLIAVAGGRSAQFEMVISWLIAAAGGRSAELGGVISDEVFDKLGSGVRG